MISTLAPKSVDRLLQRSNLLRVTRIPTMGATLNRDGKSLYSLELMAIGFAVSAAWFLVPVRSWFRLLT